MTFEVRDKNGVTTKLMSHLDDENIAVKVAAVEEAPVKKVDLNEDWKSEFSQEQRVNIEKHFTYALPGSHVEQMAFEAVQKIGLTEKNTAYTHSSCPDELNHNDPDQDITQL
jgi:hypothetical protein